MAPDQGDSQVIRRDIHTLRNLTIGFGIVIAVLLGILIAKSFTANLSSPAPGPPPPSGPPVVIRGGSVYGIAPPPSGQTYGWSPNPASSSPPPQTLTSLAQFDDSYLALDGVALKKGGPVGQYSISGLKNNWKVVLVFRDKNGNDPGDNNAKKLSICSAQDCDSSSTLTSTSIYLTGDGSGAFYQSDPVALPTDGDDIRRYDLNADRNGCTDSDGKGRHTKCNHLVRIEVFGVGTWSNGTANPSTFYCPNGACDIYAGSEK